MASAMWSISNTAPDARPGVDATGVDRGDRLGHRLLSVRCPAKEPQALVDDVVAHEFHRAALLQTGQEDPTAGPLSAMLIGTVATAGAQHRRPHRPSCHRFARLRRLPD